MKQNRNVRRTFLRSLSRGLFFTPLFFSSATPLFHSAFADPRVDPKTPLDLRLHLDDSGDALKKTRIGLGFTASPAVEIASGEFVVAVDSPIAWNWFPGQTENYIRIFSQLNYSPETGSYFFQVEASPIQNFHKESVTQVNGIVEKLLSEALSDTQWITLAFSHSNGRVETTQAGISLVQWSKAGMRHLAGTRGETGLALEDFLHLTMRIVKINCLKIQEEVDGKTYWQLVPLQVAVNAGLQLNKIKATQIRVELGGSVDGAVNLLKDHRIDPSDFNVGLGMNLYAGLRAKLDFLIDGLEIQVFGGILTHGNVFYQNSRAAETIPTFLMDGGGSGLGPGSNPSDSFFSFTGGSGEITHIGMFLLTYQPQNKSKKKKQHP